MIYIATDIHDQGVYFALRTRKPLRRAEPNGMMLNGIVGNGVSETPVTIRSSGDWTEMTFGPGDLFRFVEERTVRRQLDLITRELARH